jgi:hypothetical protein
VQIVREEFGTGNDFAVKRAETVSTLARRTILERAFTGRLVAQDPKDDPASALLSGSGRNGRF